MLNTICIYGLKEVDRKILIYNAIHKYRYLIIPVIYGDKINENTTYNTS